MNSEGTLCARPAAHTMKQAAALQKQQVARPAAPSLSPRGRQT